ncbi:effector 161-like [Podarcis lilfordi]|uniref:Effector 161-like n=1 Tax=Podarcis lilfordi TaxID=74358 RepID=A0AA35P8Y5_9SAUR|nr:effector 161-like [Podarcis lilfordi]
MIQTVNWNGVAIFQDTNGIDNTEEEEEAAAAAAGNGASKLMGKDEKPVESDNLFDDLKSQPPEGRLDSLEFSVRELSLQASLQSDNGDLQPETSSSLSPIKSEESDSPSGLRRSDRKRQKSQCFADEHFNTVYANKAVFEPKSYNDVQNLPKHQAVNWYKAMNSEIASLNEHNTWSLVPQTPDMRLIDSKWVYRVKMNDKNANGKQTPMVCGFTFTGEDKPFPNKTLYHSAIGKLNFIQRISRPDITYAFHFLAKFVEKPTTQCFSALKRVVMYLKHTKHYRLQFTSSIDKGFEIFCDASHAVEQNNCRGVSGMVFCYNGCPFEWKSQTQTIICLSTTERELCACIQATRDVEWYLQVFADLQMQVTLPVKVYLDSQSGLAVLSSETNTQRTRVLRLRLQFVKKLIADEMIVFQYVPGDYQIADIFTKALPKVTHERHVQNMLYVFVPQ